MGTLRVYNHTRTDIEEIADFVKIIVLEALLDEGVIEENRRSEIDAWAAMHTVIVRKKTVFRTLSSRWHGQEESDYLYYRVVKRIGHHDK